MIPEDMKSKVDHLYDYPEKGPEEVTESGDSPSTEDEQNEETVEKKHGFLGRLILTLKDMGVKRAVGFLKPSASTVFVAVLLGIMAVGFPDRGWEWADFGGNSKHNTTRQEAPAPVPTTPTTEFTPPPEVTESETTTDSQTPTEQETTDQPITTEDSTAPTVEQSPETTPQDQTYGEWQGGYTPDQQQTQDGQQSQPQSQQQPQQDYQQPQQAQDGQSQPQQQYEPQQRMGGTEGGDTSTNW